jgi:Fe-S oxidoreductase
MHQMQEFEGHLLNNCLHCGKCLRECKVIEFLELDESSYMKLQEQRIQSIKTGVLNKDIRQIVYACMECYYCATIECPAGIDLMSINRLVKSKDPNNPLRHDDLNRNEIRHTVLQNCSDEDTNKLLTERITRSDVVFFPGCNVYAQPDILLKALSIMDQIGEYSFLPGLNNCCGEYNLSVGNIQEGMRKGNDLVRTLIDLNPEKVIFWCPTCACNFQHLLRDQNTQNFQILTFGQFVEQNLVNFIFANSHPQKVTLHEPCKTSYMGIDLNSVRNIISAIPNLTLVEMEHHGKNTRCCGSGSVTNYQDTIFTDIKQQRLEEAAKTNADILIDVCHYCHQVFCDLAPNQASFIVENYASFITSKLEK